MRETAGFSDNFKFLQGIHLMKFETTEEKVSYGIGTQVGGQLKHSAFPGFSMDAVIEGIKDSFAGKLQIAENDLKAAFQELNEKLAKELNQLIRKVLRLYERGINMPLTDLTKIMRFLEGN